MTDQKIFSTLEFGKIKQAVQHYLQTESAERLVQAMAPSDQLDIIQTWQSETEQALGILMQGKVLPIPRLVNIDMALKRLELGASLNGQELAGIAKLLSTIHQLMKFFDQLAAEEKTYPALTAWVYQVVTLPEIEAELAQAIDEDGSVLSSASVLLASIRRQQGQMEQAIRLQLNQLLKSKASQLSDALVTMRNDRYVLPVKAEYKHQFGGTVHDQSSTGQTLYIEPQAVMELNNKRAELQRAERQEIERILMALSEALMPYQEELKRNEWVVAHLDYIQARSHYAKSLEATRPKFSDQQIVAIYQARHPLIAADKIVPNDIILGEHYQALIITGPNTGGKTILLKTLGLLQLMGQSGLHIPAEAGSRLGIFDAVYADIGDEQSIEQNLSTFSSHMTNIVSILNQVTDRSLVLFDELGSGTDPQEGALLAMAILNHLRKIGTLVMATTHYPELKLYAHETANTLNASMEFDAQTLSPTYRLLLGVPGRSNAFDISGRLGLNPSILEEARQGIKEDSQALNDMVAKLEEERRQAELDHEANAKVAQAQAQAEALIQEIRDLQLEQGQNQTIKEHVLIEKRAGFEQLKQPENLKKNKVLKKAKNNRQLKVGDDVEVLSYGQRGTIIEVKGKEYIVQMGILKMKFEQEELEPLNQVETKTKVNVHRQAGPKVQTSLDLRGERYEQALYRLRQYLDAALLSNHPMVTIIHGKGTGALRQGVKEVLAKHPQVDRFEYSPANAGGNGSTIVYFK